MSLSPVTIYFSFRSPYSCLGLYRFSRLLKVVDLEYELIPLVPPKEFIEKQNISAEKKAYIHNDIKRIFTAYGLNIMFPEPFDIDWAVPHAAFLEANEHGSGLAFANQLSMKRFCEGQNIASEPVLASLAELLGLSTEKLQTASQHRPYQKQLLLARKRMQEDGVFGVPAFVYQQELFWGNDRLEWLIRKIITDRGQAVSDLTQNPLLPVVEL